MHADFAPAPLPRRCLSHVAAFLFTSLHVLTTCSRPPPGFNNDLHSPPSTSASEKLGRMRCSGCGTVFRKQARPWKQRRAFAAVYLLRFGTEHFHPDLVRPLRLPLRAGFSPAKCVAQILLAQAIFVLILWPLLSLALLYLAQFWNDTSWTAFAIFDGTFALALAFASREVQPLSHCVLQALHVGRVIWAAVSLSHDADAWPLRFGSAMIATSVFGIAASWLLIFLHMRSTWRQRHFRRRYGLPLVGAFPRDDDDNDGFGADAELGADSQFERDTQRLLAQSRAMEDALLLREQNVAFENALAEEQQRREPVELAKAIEMSRNLNSDDDDDCAHSYSADTLPDDDTTSSAFSTDQEYAHEDGEDEETRLEAKRDECLSRVPPEPEPNNTSERVVSVAIRLPSGQQIRRRFLASHRVAHVVDWVNSQPSSFDTHDRPLALSRWSAVSRFPSRVWNDLNVILGDMDTGRSISLLVRLQDDDI